MSETRRSIQAKFQIFTTKEKSSKDIASGKIKKKKKKEAKFFL
jgi:hypothetical protein